MLGGKQMSDESSVRDTRIQTEHGAVCTLQYSLEQGETVFEEGRRETVFGIRVVMDDGGKSRDERLIRDISSKRENVECLLLLMWKNQVTPICAMDVVEDFIAETV